VSWAVQAAPLNGLAATVGLAAIFLTLGHFLFEGVGRGIWIQESTPLMGILLGYYFCVPYRLIREHQKRWDFQRRHEVLVQVEELKTNFLSLITHDLKTPVARIQGMAEMMIRGAYDRLVPKEIDALHSMVHSTEELNRFISSILELTKVESEHFQLHPESKDVNQLIEKSVENFQSLARSKEITLKTHLEPLFPIQIDPSLISKVINNLIDNAIKYSPNGSEVEIVSREVDDQVEISVRDQGIGLSEEDRKNLFGRFFRVKNEATQVVKGTGLGLYLTKYFVEAHKGAVEVESTIGNGSTFRILLPLNLKLERTAPKENSYVQSTRR
jgi:signal transduction histidine kinase